MNITIVVIGMGGVGSFLLAPLSKVMLDGKLGNNTVSRFVLIDGDSYETKNMNRQFFPAVCNGMNKAQAQQLVLKTMFPDSRVEVITFPQYITSKNIATVFEHCVGIPVIVSLVDNHACRALLSNTATVKAARGENIILITGGNEVTDGNVTIQGWWGGTRVGVPLLERHPEVATVTEGNREGLSCLEIALLPGGEQTMEANMMVAMLAYSVLLRLGSEAWVEEVSDIYFGTNPPVVRTEFRGKEENDNEQSLD